MSHVMIFIAIAPCISIKRVMRKIAPNFNVC